MQRARWRNIKYLCKIKDYLRALNNNIKKYKHRFEGKNIIEYISFYLNRIFNKNITGIMYRFISSKYNKISEAFVMKIINFYFHNDLENKILSTLQKFIHISKKVIDIK